LLAVLAFCFSLLGTFLVRSGVLTSVHAFAVDPLRGSILLGGLVVYGGAALLLFAIRAPALKGGPDWDIASREGALMANNLVLTVATVTVLLGTLFPLIAEAAGQQMTVGEPYFHLTFAPIMALLLVLLPPVQSWSWGKADVSSAFKWILGFGALLLAVWLLGISLWNLPLGAVIGVSLGLWLVAGSVIELQRRAITLKRLFRLPLRVWGMSLAHIGLGLFVIGAVVETGGRYEGTLALEPGHSGEVAGWTVTLDNVSGIEGPNWYADKAHLTVQRGNKVAVLEPEKRYYPAAGMPSTETAILKTGLGDLYAAIGDKRDVDGRSRWTFRIYYNPLIDLVFLGVLLIGLGGLLAMFGGRKQSSVSTSEHTQETAV
ncbi:MAG: cytochrome c-type biogenesis CcmF C-terminal domain-containing protein, partial [Hyphomonadaceae bacterium]